MPKINRYVDIDSVEREAKKDYIDRHSPFVHCEGSAKKGEKFPVTVKVGNEYTPLANGSLNLLFVEVAISHP